MAKCLIAGLPAAGKSTYIGALAYILLNPVINQVLMLDENPDDLSYLNKLIDPWLNLEKIERTTRGFADIAGEDYESIVNMNSDVIASWSDKPDALLLFINEWDNDVLKEQLGEDKQPADKNAEPPAFELKDISSTVQNVLLLKELHLLFPWKRLAIGLSSWDKYQDDYRSPIDMLKSRAPFLYNFVTHYFPNTYIFGVSAQGDEYNKDNKNSLIERTEKGTRAFIVDSKGKQSYDLTLPLNFLISD